MENLEKAIDLLEQARNIIEGEFDKIEEASTNLNITNIANDNISDMIEELRSIVNTLR